MSWKDEQFASERVRLAQLTNKLGSSRGKLQSPRDHLGCLPVYSYRYTIGSLSWLVCKVGFDQNLQIFLGGFKVFLIFTPNLTWGNDPIWRSHFFQMGWFNHQLEMNMKGLLKPMMLFLRPFCLCKGSYFLGVWHMIQAYRSQPIFRMDN